MLLVPMAIDAGIGEFSRYGRYMSPEFKINMRLKMRFPKKICSGNSFLSKLLVFLALSDMLSAAYCVPYSNSAAASSQFNIFQSYYGAEMSVLMAKVEAVSLKLSDAVEKQKKINKIEENINVQYEKVIEREQRIIAELKKHIALIGSKRGLILNKVLIEKEKNKSF